MSGCALLAAASEEAERRGAGAEAAAEAEEKAAANAEEDGAGAGAPRGLPKENGLRRFPSCPAQAPACATDALLDSATHLFG